MRSERRRFSLRNLANNPWHPRWLPGSLRDTLSNRHHSQDFNFARSEYLRVRVMFVGIVFALLSPIWIVVDYVFLPSSLMMNVAIGRAVMMFALCGVLFYADHSRYKLNHVLHALAMLLLIPAFFYAGLLVMGQGEMTSLVGYSFIPLLLVAFLSVFPLTLLESLGIGVLLFALQLLAEVQLGQLGTPMAWQNLWLLATVLAISLWANYSQVSTLMRLYRQASLDPLTDLLNRGVLLEQLKGFMSLREQKVSDGEEPPPLAALMFDLDRFKRVNDTYGHSVGDQVLVAFANVLRKSLRSTDIVARYGGEEFFAALPGTHMADAERLAERIRAACEETVITAHDGRRLGFTSSIGVTELRAGETLDQLLIRVDSLLYEAKNGGRNRVVPG